MRTRAEIRCGVRAQALACSYNGNAEPLAEEIPAPHHVSHESSRGRSVLRPAPVRYQAILQRVEPDLSSGSMELGVPTPTVMEGAKIDVTHYQTVNGDPTDRKSSERIGPLPTYAR